MHFKDLVSSCRRWSCQILALLLPGDLSQPLFIADGWFPNEQLASIQPYMLTYLLPVLIAATGGRMIGKDRGMVMGAIAIMGCIAGVGGVDGQPMLMAAMFMGHWLDGSSKIRSDDGRSYASRF